MVHIGNQWVITEDPMNFIVARNKPVTRRLPDGTHVTSYKPEGYFQSMTGALKFIRKKMVMKELDTAAIDLDTAIARLEQLDADFLKSLEILAVNGKLDAGKTKARVDEPEEAGLEAEPQTEMTENIEEKKENGNEENE